MNALGTVSKLEWSWEGSVRGRRKSGQDFWIFPRNARTWEGRWNC